MRLQSDEERQRNRAARLLGANLEPLNLAAGTVAPEMLRVRNWWEPAPVHELRRDLCGDWEGMHATPSEIAIAQCLLGPLPANQATEPPERLSAAYLRAHKGDRHSPPAEHRAAFPDGRVGSHSALATPEDGRRLLDAAAKAIAQDFAALEALSLGR